MRYNETWWWWKKKKIDSIAPYRPAFNHLVGSLRQQRVTHIMKCSLALRPYVSICLFHQKVGITLDVVDTISWKMKVHLQHSLTPFQVFAVFAFRAPLGAESIYVSHHFCSYVVSAFSCLSASLLRPGESIMWKRARKQKPGNGLI